MDGKGQGTRQADGRGPAASLWKGSLASSGDSPGWRGRGKSPCGEEAEAGKGSPQLQPFSPGACSRTSQSRRRGTRRRRCEPGAVARTQPRCQLWTRPQGCTRPQALRSTKEGEGLVTDHSAPRRSSSGQGERGSTPRWGPPGPIHAEQPVWPRSLAPIGSPRAGIGAQWT